MEFRFELSAWTDDREETEAEARERLRDVIVQLQHVGFRVEVIDSPFPDVATSPTYPGGGEVETPLWAPPTSAPSTSAFSELLATWNTTAPITFGTARGEGIEEVDPF